ncbi:MULTISPECIES: hypothetical protein [unclassified Ochrobactrum]|uniref:hypothetical protein n=1 Tax=unclassified Ochrobactrum TaxID=239106 RepID=UPI0030ACF037
MLQIFRQKTFWKRTLWWTWKVYEFFCVTIVTLYFVFMLVAMVVYFNDSYVLPNKMVVKRVFNFTLHGQSDLFTSDGYTRLAEDMEFMCFNDRYIEVFTMDPGGGVFDGETNLPVPKGKRDITGLSKPPYSCYGYYTAWVGPDLLYERSQDPLVVSCKWRNYSNPNLKNLAWLEKRRCRSRR